MVREPVLYFKAWTCFAREFVMAVEGQVFVPYHTQRVYQFLDCCLLTPVHCILRIAICICSPNVAYPNRIFIVPFHVRTHLVHGSTGLNGPIKKHHEMVPDVRPPSGFMPFSYCFCTYVSAFWRCTAVQNDAIDFSHGYKYSPLVLCLTLDFHSPCLALVGAFLSAYSLVPTRVLYQRTFRNYRGQRSLSIVIATVTRCLGPFLITEGRSLVRSLCEYKAT